MEEVPVMNSNALDGSLKNERNSTANCVDPNCTSPSIAPKSAPKRIIYDLSDTEKAKNSENEAFARKSRLKRISRSKKRPTKPDGFKKRELGEGTRRRKLVGNKTRLGVTINDLRGNIKPRDELLRNVDSKDQIEYTRDPTTRDVACEGMQSSNAYVKEELKRDILTLKSKLEGVEAKVNNNYFPAQTVTKIECHSNYQLDLKKCGKSKPRSLDGKNEHYTQSKTYTSVHKSGKDVKIQSKCHNSIRSRKRHTGYIDEKDHRSRRHDTLDNRRKKSTSDKEMLRNKPVSQKGVGKGRRERITPKDVHKSQSRFPSGDLSVLRSQRNENEVEEKNHHRAKRNRSASPLKGQRTHHQYEESSKQSERRKGNDPCQLPVSKLPWPQIKGQAEKSVSFVDGFTLSQDAFGLHPTSNPMSLKIDQNFYASRSKYGDKSHSSTSVSGPKLEDRERFSGKSQKHEKGKGVDFKIANDLSGDEMLRYIQHCSRDYAHALDKTFPDLRRVVGFLIKTDLGSNGVKGRCEEKDSNQPLPCDVYNKTGTCNYPIVHLDSKQDQRIHSCSLCYFILGGLINMHRQSKCPLLNIIKK